MINKNYLETMKVIKAKADKFPPDLCQLINAFPEYPQLDQIDSAVAQMLAICKQLSSISEAIPGTRAIYESPLYAGFALLDSHGLLNESHALQNFRQFLAFPLENQPIKVLEQLAAKNLLTQVYFDYLIATAALSAEDTQELVRTIFALNASGLLDAMPNIMRLKRLSEVFLGIKTLYCEGMLNQTLLNYLLASKCPAELASSQVTLMQLGYLTGDFAAENLRKLASLTAPLCFAETMKHFQVAGLANQQVFNTLIGRDIKSLAKILNIIHENMDFIPHKANHSLLQQNNYSEIKAALKLFCSEAVRKFIFEHSGTKIFTKLIQHPSPMQFALAITKFTELPFLIPLYDAIVKRKEPLKLISIYWLLEKSSRLTPYLEYFFANCPDVLINQINAQCHSAAEICNFFKLQNVKSPMQTPMAFFALAGSAGGQSIACLQDRSAILLR